MENYDGDRETNSDTDSPTRMNRRHCHGQVRVGFYRDSLLSVILEHKQQCVNIVNLDAVCTLAQYNQVWKIN